jgi:hypothetical protein
MAFKRKATIVLSGHTVTVDAEDVERIESAGPWKPFPFDQNRVTWLRNRGTTSKPAFELLAHFIMAASDNQYAELIDRSVLDYRKSNLKVR